MAESNLDRAKKGDLILVHSDHITRPLATEANRYKTPATLLLVWDTDFEPREFDLRRSSSDSSDSDVSSPLRAISLTDLLPRQGQRQALAHIQDPDEFCRLLYEVIIDPLFQLNGSFEPMVRSVNNLVAEDACVFLRPSTYAVRKVWLEDSCF